LISGFARAVVHLGRSQSTAPVMPPPSDVYPSFLLSPEALAASVVDAHKPSGSCKFTSEYTYGVCIVRLVARSSEATRLRILAAAYKLFYRRGFSRVSVEEIAERAGITKRSLYYHFESKDELLAAVLDRQQELSFAQIRQYEERYRGSPEEIVSALFSAFARWSAQAGWTGAGFTRIVMELADMPGHPARKAAHRHKMAVERWIAEILGQAGVASASERAKEIVLLVEGANALILTHGDRGYADTAARAARKLLEER
jgi:AcrR family transcriptional regulator